MKLESKECIMKRWSDVVDGKLITIENVDGMNFPFQIYIPNNINSLTNIVLALTTPGIMKDYTFDEALKILKGDSKINEDGSLEDIENNSFINGVNPIIRYLSYNCGNVCLIPRIPRTIGFDSSYLGYKVYHNEFDVSCKAIDAGKIKYTKEEMNNFIDLDKQIYKMIQCTMAILNEMNIAYDDKVIVTGYSAASKFSNFFTALHPDIVKAVIAGGTGGNSIIPDKELQQLYPVGVYDINNFDFETFKSIPQFYFIGDSDYNDLARFKPKYELDIDGKPMKDIDGNTIPKRNDGQKGYHDEIIDGQIKHIPDKIPFDKIEYDLDENGNYQVAYDDGYYTIEQIEYIIKNLGENVQDRFDKISEKYKELGVNAIFKKYPGNHQTVYNNDELFEDIAMFFKNNLQNKESIKK